jgi:BMFP domain-containing protein YqiC
MNMDLAERLRLLEARVESLEEDDHISDLQRRISELESKVADPSTQSKHAGYDWKATIQVVRDSKFI